MTRFEELVTLASKHIVSLEDFLTLAQESVLALMNADIEMVPVSSTQYSDYVLPLLTKPRGYLRPINRSLFVDDYQELKLCHGQFQNLLAELCEKRGDLTFLPKELRRYVDEGPVGKTIYTTLQGIGCVLDTSPNVQGARKNFGQRFEDFVRIVLNEMGVVNESFTFQTTITPIKITYHVPLDLIFNPKETVYSTPSRIDQRDTILSIKTSSKDRMKLIFIDRFVLRTVLNLKRMNYVALCHNDVQRTGENRISSTFVPNVYLVFCHIFGDLSLYYVDPPRLIADSRFKDRIKTLETFMLSDIWGFQ